MTKKEQFRRALGKIIREELRAVLPEVLSEMYLRRLVETQGRSQYSNSLAEQLGEDDQVPQSLGNTHRGVYEPTGDPVEEEERERPRMSEAVKRLVEQTGVDSYIFEDVKPLAESGMSTAQQMFGDAGVPLDMLPGLSRARELMGEVAENEVSRGPISTSAEAKLREIEARRKALDVPVNEARARGLV